MAIIYWLKAQHAIRTRLYYSSCLVVGCCNIPNTSVWEVFAPKPPHYDTV